MARWHSSPSRIWSQTPSMSFAPTPRGNWKSTGRSFTSARRAERAGGAGAGECSPADRRAVSDAARSLDEAAREMVLSRRRGAVG